MSNASAWVLSWRWPGVKMTRKGLPKPATVRWILHLKPPRLRPSACAPCFFARLRHRDERVPSWRQSSRVRYRDQRPMQRAVVPTPHFAPTHKPLVYRIPHAILGGQQAPLCAAAAHPLHRLHEAAARLLISADVGPRLLAQEGVDPGPVGVAQSNVGHTSYSKGSCLNVNRI